MYQDIIHTLNPKPKFNTTFYKDADLYSDGDVEDTIIKIIAENDPDQYTDAIQNHMSWPVYYHLTHIRKNMLFLRTACRHRLMNSKKEVRQSILRRM